MSERGALRVESDNTVASCDAVFAATAERARASGDLDLVADIELERVLTAGLRLYAAKVDRDDKSISGDVASVGCAIVSADRTPLRPFRW